MANKGWELVELSDAEQAVAEETLAIRGYRLLKHETRTIHVKAGEHLVYENDKARAPRRPRRAPATRARDARPRHTRPGPCSHAPWALLSADLGTAAFVQVRPVDENPRRSKPSLEVTTGATAANGLTISTGHQIAKSSDVKEVKPGCCTLL